MSSQTLSIAGLAAYAFCEIFALGEFFAGRDYPNRPLPYRAAAILGEIALVVLAIRGLS